MFCTQKIKIVDEQDLKVDDLESLPPQKIKKSSSTISLEEIQEGIHDTSLDWFGRFKDPQLREEYHLSCVNQKSRKSSLLLSFFILGWAVVETIAYNWFYFGGTGKGNIGSFFSIVLLFAALILSFFLHGNEHSRIHPDYHKSHLQFRSRLQVGFIILLNFVFFLKIILRIEDTHTCIPESLHVLPKIDHILDGIASPEILNSVHDTITPITCTPEDIIVSRTCVGTILLMSICPQLLIAILYEPRTCLVLACHLVITSLLLVVSLKTVYFVLPLLVTSLVTTVLFYELHFQRIQSFLHHRQLQQILNDREKNADAIHAMEMRHMIGNVAHDLKTPLSSFTNGLDLITDILASANEKVVSELRDGKVCMTEEMFREHFSPVNSCIQNIRNTTSFMLMTINRCIDYTKASKGMKLVPKYETVDLREALQFPIECMINIQERIGITLSPLSEKICRFIITDKQWLQENLLCLLSNAVKYSTEGNVTINAHISSAASVKASVETILKQEVENDVPYLIFEIEDTGIGLSEEAMMNLFNPFKQAQRLAGGTGLGLYSLAKRMEALKGNYGVRKRKDGKQGSLFWFAIPYKEDQMTAGLFRGKESSSVRVGCPALNDEIIRSLGSLEVLIVDDSPSILKMSSMMLKRQGHNIQRAENGEIALKRIEEKWKDTGRGFDLVLMDLQMPVMDGLEAVRRLRSMEVEGREWMVDSESDNNLRQHQLVFGVSANSDHETMQDAFQAGFDDFIGKPFSVEMFNRTIQKHLLHPRS